MDGGWSLTITTETAAVATTTTVTSSDATSTTGQSVTFSAAVATGAGTPVGSGTVQFVDETTNTSLGSQPVNTAGVATVSTSTLAEGTHLIRATFSPTAGFLTSNGTFTQRVDNPTAVTGNTFCNTGAIPDRVPVPPRPTRPTSSSPDWPGRSPR